MRSVFIALSLLAVYSSVNGLRVHNFGKHGTQMPKSTIPPFKTFYIEQNLDHFNHRDDRTFEQRYLLNDDFFDAENGPVFFYAGNEGDIEVNQSKKLTNSMTFFSVLSKNRTFGTTPASCSTLRPFSRR